MPDIGSGTQDQRDAFKRGNDFLLELGLPELAQWMWDGIVAGTSEEAMEIDLYDQPAFKARYPVIEQRRQAGLPPVSVADVLSYEDGWNQLARMADLPPAFRGRDVAQRLMGSNVSMVEAKERVDGPWLTVRNAAPEIRQTFTTWFGHSGDSALAAFFLDPEMALPDLERMVHEAEIGGLGTIHGWDVSRTMADRMARMGVTTDQAQTGFGQLDQQRSLFQQTIDEQRVLTPETGIEATFGLDGQAAADVKRRADQRQAIFSGAATVAEDQSGLVGAGSARQV